MPDCPIEGGECLEWVYKYLMDCVCDFRDEVSLVLGLVSVFSWGVAEVPQIITNFKEQNTEGVSLTFLMTWVIGDVFNLAGCYLEPATLPTQFYMALLYTLTTIVLVLQTVYYDYFRSYFHPPELIKDKPSAGPEEVGAEKPTKLDVEAQKQPRPDKRSSSSSPELSSSIINVPHGHHRASKDLYYTSARSLASSHTPTVGSYLVGSRESGSHTQSFLRPASTQDSVAAAQEYPISGHDSASPQGDSPASSNSAGGGSVLGKSATAAAASVLLVGTVGLSSNFLSGGSFGFAQQGGGRGLQRAGRSLLLRGSGGSRIPHYFGEAEWNGPWGEVFGWCMAAIYMGGRLPQILLNIKRGTVEGLNPLMFIFALLGNATYVSSILVRTLDWALIKPNMPWLVDAAVCVGLDCFIIGQFLYYASSGVKVEGGDSEQEEDKKGSYELVR